MSVRIEISDYLLGELSPQRRAEAERLMREDPDFRAEVERLRPAVQRLEELPPEAWQDAEPPPLALPRDPAPAATEPAARAPRWWQRPILRPAFATLASVALLAVGIGVGMLLAEDDGAGEPSRTLALEPVEPRGEGASGAAELVGAGGGEATIEVTGIGPNEAGEFYELWLLNAPDDLISLGSFKVDSSGEASVRVPVPVDPAEFEYLDLSIEQDDGDASHSGRSILRAPT